MTPEGRPEMTDTPTIEDLEERVLAGDDTVTPEALTDASRTRLGRLRTEGHRRREEAKAQREHQRHVNRTIAAAQSDLADLDAAVAEAQSTLAEAVAGLKDASVAYLARYDTALNELGSVRPLPGEMTVDGSAIFLGEQRFEPVTLRSVIADVLVAGSVSETPDPAGRLRFR